ncbi:MAG: peptide chain release factor N(5)-glutamine methyltransferase [Bacteroidetes bacterium]|nr:peptide chain release factor N(5)-glutamine methyltransferase [Bacteroidota bacterium]
MIISEAQNFYSQSLLNLYPTHEAESITKIVLQEVLSLSKTEMVLSKQQLIASEETEKLNAIFEELNTGKPLQYILGYSDFYGLRFKVTPATLIPRPETEELVAMIIKENQARQNLKILDIGTGSGCIPISIAKAIPTAKVYAVDISADALAIAQENAENNNVNIDFTLMDILQENQWQQLPTMDIIISNPPYIEEGRATKLHKNVIDFEPHTALFVPDNNPLLFYEAILKFSQTQLTKGGKIYFEINEELAEETKNLCVAYGFADAEVRMDMQGKERFVSWGRIKI